MIERKQAVSVGTRWAARLSGLALAVMAFAFLLGSGFPNLFAQPAEVLVQFIAFGMMLAGFLLGWRWAGIGGGLAFVGFVLFCGVEFIVNGAFPGGAIPLFAVPGILFLISHVISRDVRPTAG